MPLAKKLSLYVMSLLYVFIGINHFIQQEKFERIVPPFIPHPLLCVYISGALEIILGSGLLFPALRRYAAIGIIVLLIAIFPANIYMYTSGKFTQFPQWLLLLRLPVQVLLIAWAAIFTTKKKA